MSDDIDDLILFTALYSSMTDDPPEETQYSQRPLSAAELRDIDRRYLSRVADENARKASALSALDGSGKTSLPDYLKAMVRNRDRYRTREGSEAAFLASGKNREASFTYDGSDYTVGGQCVSIRINKQKPFLHLLQILELTGKEKGRPGRYRNLRARREDGKTIVLDTDSVLIPVSEFTDHAERVIDPAFRDRSRHRFGQNDCLPEWALKMISERRAQRRKEKNDLLDRKRAAEQQIEKINDKENAQMMIVAGLFLLLIFLLAATVHC